MKKQNLAGSLLFTGTIIGAGILGLPYALSQSGFIGGTIIFIAGTFFAYLSAMHIGTLVYMQNREASLYSIYQSYLGASIGYLALAGILFSSYGAMIAYPLAVGMIFSSLLDIPLWLSAGIFIALISLLLSLNIGESNKFNALGIIIFAFAGHIVIPNVLYIILGQESHQPKILGCLILRRLSHRPC